MNIIKFILITFFLNSSISIQASDRHKKLITQANRGDAAAQFKLGKIYGNRRGDYRTAIKWYLRAANQGEPEALYNLGNMHRKGYGVLQDYKKAHVFYNLSRYFGWKFNPQTLTDLEEKMTPKNIEEAQKMAHKWLRDYQRKN
ncbi:tetratricopeptide repeat protein [Temperatibacter marinus]|uniref:Tetratricopeptide repeat protein n=1 Tax=Temperatibacter marinus TaxID=1456591 RepID=A0AA52HAE4_9PROT|nr:tetratricopeptide repeat protein [Temperatibacter marinus]WND02513.1 tetratricopeptide repeat protein [Temperatibacter marinus]